MSFFAGGLPLGRLLVLLLLLVPLAACEDARDATRLAICRQAAQALAGPDTPLTFAPGPGSDEPPPAPDSVVIDYQFPEPQPHPGWAICSFEAGSPLEPLQLEGVTTSTDGRLPPATLFFLRTYGLGQPSGMRPSFGPLPPQLLLAQQVADGLRLGGILALAAMGFTLVYAHVGRLHLAMGDFATMGALTALLFTAFLAASGSFPLWLVVALAALAGCLSASLWALLTGTGAFGRLWRQASFAPLIAAVGLSIALREAARISQNWREPWLPDLLPPPVYVPPSGGLTLQSASMINAVTAVAVCLLVGGLMRHTSFGRQARAISDDPEMARIAGVPVARIRAAIFGLGGLLAGLAGILMLLTYGTVGSEGGFILGLKAAAAAVAGGIGSLPGALAGGFVIGIFEVLWSANFDPGYRDLADFVLLAVMLLFRPMGAAQKTGRHL